MLSLMQVFWEKNQNHEPCWYSRKKPHSLHHYHLDYIMEGGQHDLIPEEEIQMEVTYEGQNISNISCIIKVEVWA